MGTGRLRASQRGRLRTSRRAARGAAGGGRRARTARQVRDAVYAAEQDQARGGRARQHGGAQPAVTRPGPPAARSPPRPPAVAADGAERCVALGCCAVRGFRVVRCFRDQCCFSGECGHDAALDGVRHRRFWRRRQHRGHRGELVVHRRTVGTARHVRREPPGPAAAGEPCPVLSERRRVRVPLAGHPPPPSGETVSAAAWFPDSPRKCARNGSSRARPRAHRLFTVPSETARITATSATG